MLSVHFARGTEDRKYSCLINMSYVGTRRTIFNGCEWYCNVFFNGISAIHSCTSVCLINLSTMWFCSQGLQLAVRYKSIGLTPIIQFSSIVDRSVHQTRKKNMNFVHLLLFSFVLLASLHWTEGGQSISVDDFLRPRRKEGGQSISLGPLLRPRTDKNGVCDGPGRGISFKCQACCHKCRHNYLRPACEQKCCAVCNFWLKREERPCWVLVCLVPIGKNSKYLV